MRIDDKLAHNAPILYAQEQQKEFERFIREMEDILDATSLIYFREQEAKFAAIAAQPLMQIEASEWGRNVSVRASNDVQQVGYGYVRTGGLMSFVSANQGDTGRWLHLYVTLLGHEIDRFQDLYLDGEKIPFPLTLDGDNRRTFGWASAGTEWADLVFLSALNRGTANQAADSNLVGQSNVLFPGKWTNAHRQRGHAGVYLILKYDAEQFKNGLPDIAIELESKNNIYDPRDDSTGYTDNAALCLANYLTDTKFGPGISWDDIDTDALSDAADCCGEHIALAGGGVELRYTVNGVFTASAGTTHQRVIGDMLRSMAGDLIWTGGQWRILAGKYRAPSLTLTEHDLRSGVRMLAKPGNEKLTNGVRGGYKSRENNFEITDYPQIKNELYRQQDGKHHWGEMDLPFTNSASMAQRLAKIYLEDSRQWIEVDADFGLRSAQLQAGDTIALTLERFGWSAKEFRVLDLDLKPAQALGGPVSHVRLRLKETASGIYDWNNGEETTVDLAPNTDLPSPANIAAPSNLQLFSGTEQLDIRADGTIFSRILATWDPTTDPYLLTGGLFEIQFKQSSASEWRSGGYVDGAHSKAWILDVADREQYDVRVRGVTIYKGQWATVSGHNVIGKTEPPSNVENATVELRSDGFHFQWPSISDRDLAEYEIRLGDTWDSGTVVVRTKATKATYKTVASGDYRFFIRAVDTSGNYSEVSDVLNISILQPGTPINLNAFPIYQHVQLRWSAPTSTSFPIDEYRIYKGPTFASAELAGRVSATFIVLQELLPGTYTYWVTALDFYGNESLPVSQTVRVDSPPLLEVEADDMLDVGDADTLTNIVIENDYIVAPVDTAITYQAHFTSNSWDTPQDQINAGYPRYAHPAETDDAVYEQIKDYGVEIAAVLITLTYYTEWVSSSGTIVSTISYSANGSDWTDAVGVSQVLAQDFRYVRVRLTITGDDDLALVKVSHLRLRLDVKTDFDSGITAAVSTDGSGTLLTLNKEFIDIKEKDVSVSYVGSNAYFATWTISGNDVRSFLYNTSGTRVSGNVRWEVKGILANT